MNRERRLIPCAYCIAVIYAFPIRAVCCRVRFHRRRAIFDRAGKKPRRGQKLAIFLIFAQSSWNFSSFARQNSAEEMRFNQVENRGKQLGNLLRYLASISSALKFTYS